MVDCSNLIVGKIADTSKMVEVATVMSFEVRNCHDWKVDPHGLALLTVLTRPIDACSVDENVNWSYMQKRASGMQ